MSFNINNLLVGYIILLLTVWLMTIFVIPGSLISWHTILEDFVQSWHWVCVYSVLNNLYCGRDFKAGRYRSPP